jgi:hypothetical protein
MLIACVASFATERAERPTSETFPLLERDLEAVRLAAQELRQVADALRAGAVDRAYPVAQGFQASSGVVGSLGTLALHALGITSYQRAPEGVTAAEMAAALIDLADDLSQLASGDNGRALEVAIVFGRMADLAGRA